MEPVNFELVNCQLVNLELVDCQLVNHELVDCESRKLRAQYQQAEHLPPATCEPKTTPIQLATTPPPPRGIGVRVAGRASASLPLSPGQ
jgi:hypothetical protein